MTVITGGELFARCPRQRGHRVPVRPALSGDRPALRRARGPRHQARDDPPRGRRGAHGGGPLQDDREGRGGSRQPRPRLGEPPGGRRDREARGRAAARDHVAASPRHRVPVDRPRRSRGRTRSTCSGPPTKWNAPDPAMGAHPRGAPPRASARCGTAARPRARRPAGTTPLRGTQLRAKPRSCRRPRTAPLRPAASASQLDEAAELLAGARRPVVISGSGVDRGEANEAVLDLVELLGCPVMTSMAGRATVPNDHPNYVMGFGAAGDLAKQEADVLLVVGSRMGNLDTPFDKYWGDPVGSEADPDRRRPRQHGRHAPTRARHRRRRARRRRGPRRPPPQDGRARRLSRRPGALPRGRPGDADRRSPSRSSSGRGQASTRRTPWE